MPESWLNEAIAKATVPRPAEAGLQHCSGDVRLAVAGDVGDGIGDAERTQDGFRFGFTTAGREPARAVGDREHHDQEKKGRQRGHAELHVPVERTQIHAGDDRVAEIGDEDAEHDVELERTDHHAALFGRRDLGDVDGGEHRRRADREPGEHAEGEQRAPVPRSETADARD
jgi:hypothetical protein